MQLRRFPTCFCWSICRLLALCLLTICSWQSCLPCVAQRAAEPAQLSPTDGSPVMDGQGGRELALDQFRPRSMLKVRRTQIARARFPVVDIHSHFGTRLRGSSEQLDEFVRVMDQNNIAVCVSLDATLGSSVESHRDYLWSKYRDRFAFFVHPNWKGTGKPDDPAGWALNHPDFVRNTVQQLRDAKEQGAVGLKLFKGFGLEYRNADGSLTEIDDPRFDPIWQTCGDLKMPILVHTADPAAFFLPVDQYNERWEELHRRPEWSFPADRFPTRESLHNARNRMIGKHPQTTFIAAHVANNAEDLESVSQWLEEFPNMYVELASRIGELGRQPYTARGFLIKYADRVLFGTDGPWPEQRLTQYWRFLETFDEYFPYSEKDFPPQGFWQIYGVGLPDEILRKIYHENAQRLIPGLVVKVVGNDTNRSDKQESTNSSN